MAEFEVNFTLDPQPEIEADFSIEVGGITEHNLLSNRDIPDQHPISAITGLQEALDTIPDDYVSEAELEAALLEKQDVISDLDEIRAGAEKGSTAVQPSDLNNYATKQYVDDGLSGKQDTLTAGANVQIIGNTISATDTTYTAGTGISIENGVISNTQTSAEWGNIQGNISAQTDLQNALDGKADISDIPTKTSDLTNDSGFITLSALTPYATQNWVSQQGYLTEIPAEYVTDSELTTKGYQTAAQVETAITSKGYTTMSAVEAKGYITNDALVGYATENYVTTAIGTETTNRQNADNNLQSQIDAITASSDVTDIVGTYAELQAYDTSTLPPNSIIKVLQDESRNNETTYYRWVITGGVGAWSLIGEEGPYYTISAADAKFATQTALSTGLSGKQDTISDLSTIRSGAALGATAVQPSDLATVATSGSYNDLSNKPTIPTVNNPTITFTQGGTTKGTITLNQSSNQTIAFDAGGGGGSSYTAGTGIDITNNVISVDSSIVTTNTAQDITARKTFFGEKAIYFKQNAAINKLGFTLYNNNNKEVGALEFRPNTIDSTPILTLNSPAPSETSVFLGNSYVGFRYWYNAINILAPFSTSFANKNFFIPVTFTNGTTTIESTSTDGSVDISSLLPTKTSDLTNDSGYITSSALTGYEQTSNKVTSISSSSTNTQYPSAKCVYDIVGDIETLINAL